VKVKCDGRRCTPFLIWMQSLIMYLTKIIRGNRESIEIVISRSRVFRAIRNGVHLRPSHLTFTKIDFKKKFIQGKVLGSSKELQSRGPEIIYSSYKYACKRLSWTVGEQPFKTLLQDQSSIPISLPDICRWHLYIYLVTTSSHL
jgi:hypothetical protein